MDRAPERNVNNQPQTPNISGPVTAPSQTIPAASYEKAHSGLSQPVGTAGHHTREVIKPGWIELPPEHLPQSTYWPVVVALGITFIAFGLTTTVLITILGLILLAIGIAGWIGDVRGDIKQEQEIEHE